MAKVFWYKFENNTTDSSGNGKDATNYGTSGYVTDPTAAGGYARSFATSNDYTSTNTSSIKPTNWTIKTRIRFTGSLSGYFFAMSTNVGGILLGLQGSKISVRVYDDNATAWRDVTDTQYPIVGNWYDVHATFDSSYIRLYVNGNQVGTPYALSSWEKQYGGATTLGRYYSSSYTCYSDIAECWMDDTVWTPTDIRNDFQTDFGINSTSQTFPIPIKIQEDYPASTWSTIDLDNYVSGGLPATTSGVIVRFSEFSGYLRYIGVRKTGSTDARTTQLRYQTAVNFYIGVDATHSIDLYCETPSSVVVEIIGYMKSSNSTFFTNATNITPGVTTWTSVDCSALVPAGAKAAILEVTSTTAGGACDFRIPGDSVDLSSLGYDPGHFGFIVPLDANRTFQAKTQIATVSLYLVGYITVGTFRSSRTDLSLTSYGSYVDIDLASYSPPVGAQAVFVGHGSGDYYIRPNNGIYKPPLDQLGSGAFGRDTFVTDTYQNVVEGIAYNSAADFYLSGFIGGPVSMDGSGTLSHLTGRMEMWAGIGSLKNWSGTANGFWCYIGGSNISKWQGTSQGQGNLGNHASGSFSKWYGTAQRLNVMFIEPDPTPLNWPWTYFSHFTGSAVIIPGTAGSLLGLSKVFTGFGLESGRVFGRLPIFTSIMSQANITYGNLLARYPAYKFANLWAYGVSLGDLTSGRYPVYSSIIVGIPSSEAAFYSQWPDYTIYARVVGVVTTEGGEIAAIVVCLDNGANTEYTNYDFNSLSYFNGNIYAAKSDGLYLVGGDLDAGTAISSTIETTLDDFGVVNKKGVAEIVLATKGGSLSIQNRTADGDYSGMQYTPASENVFKNRRISVPKGLQHRFWSTLIKNKNGADFVIDSLENNIIPLKRKINE